MTDGFTHPGPWTRGHHRSWNRSASSRKGQFGGASSARSWRTATYGMWCSSQTGPGSAAGTGGEVEVFFLQPAATAAVAARKARRFIETSPSADEPGGRLLRRDAGRQRAATLVEQHRELGRDLAGAAEEFGQEEPL